jgi:hypothetical protein
MDLALARIGYRPVIQNRNQPTGCDMFFDDVCRYPNESMVGRRSRDHQLAAVENKSLFYVGVQTSPINLRL